MGLVFVVTSQARNLGQSAHQGDTSTRDHTFLNGRSSCMQSIFNTGFLFLHFDLGGSANLDHCNTACQLGNAFLQLLAIVVRRRIFDLDADFIDARLDGLCVTGTIDDGAVVLVHRNTLGGTQVLQSRGLQIQANFFRDNCTARQDSNILQHGLATIAEARRLASGNLNDAAQVVHHQSGQCFSLHVLSNNYQRLARFGDLLQQRQQLTNVGDFLLHQQNERLLCTDAHVLLVVDEVRGEITAIELHALYHIQLIFQAGTFFNRDHAFFTHFVHCFCNDLADRCIAVG